MIAIPELASWQNSAKPVAKAIEQLDWMH